MASKVKKSEFVGIGAAIQAIGLIVCFIAFPFGVVAGIILLIVGSRMAIVYKCSECRGKVDKEAMVCQHCRANFGSPNDSSKGNNAMRDAMR